MSTATQSTVSKATLAAFLSTYKDTKITVESCNGMLLMSVVTSAIGTGPTRFATLCVGDHDGEDIAFSVSHTDVIKYVRNTNAKDDITVSIDADKRKLIMDSNKIGTITIDSADKVKGATKSANAFGTLGEYKTTISLGDVRLANEITDRCDCDSSRYALANVMFDDGKVIATDGRRLVMLQTSGEHTDTIVDSGVIKYASKFGFEIEVFEESVIAGDLIVDRLPGRYPNWKQVLPGNADNVTTMNGNELRKLVDGFIGRAKATGTEDEWGVDIKIGDLAAKLDSRFVKLAIGKLNAITIAYSGNAQLASKKNHLTVPVVLTSNERPGWTEIIMPMGRDR